MQYRFNNDFGYSMYNLLFKILPILLLWVIFKTSCKSIDLYFSRILFTACEKRFKSQQRDICAMEYKFLFSIIILSVENDIGTYTN